MSTVRYTDTGALGDSYLLEVEDGKSFKYPLLWFRIFEEGKSSAAIVLDRGQICHLRDQLNCWLREEQGEAKIEGSLCP